MRDGGSKGIGGIGIAILVIIAILALGGIVYVMLNYGVGTRGSGNVISQDFMASGFSSVQVGGGFTVNVTQGISYQVRVFTDDNIMGLVVVNSTNGTLHVGLKPGSIVRLTTLRVEITMPSMTSIDLSGGTQGRMSGFVAMTQNRLAIMLSGGSSLEVVGASVASFTASLSGGSSLRGSITASGGVDSNFMLSGGCSVSLSGTAGDMIIDASGGSSLDLLAMEAHDVRVTLSGACSAKVNMDGTLNADLSGLSSLAYTGTPTIGSLVLSGGSSAGPL